tara:strand:- start:1194 stop:1448 length:255 start_codon:yes stop_codon:yes gene_type:complete
MTIRQTTFVEQPVIDLTGPGGNAYALLGMAKGLHHKHCDDIGMPKDFEVIEREMISSGYENLVRTFDSYFGDFVILEHPTEYFA